MLIGEEVKDAIKGKRFNEGLSAPLLFPFTHPSTTYNKLPFETTTGFYHCI